MKFIVLILFFLSFGTMIQVPVGSNSYNLQFAELLLVFAFLWLFINKLRANNELIVDRHDFQYLIVGFSCFMYALLTFFWSDYGVSSLPGALSIFVGFSTYFLATQYNQDYIKWYVLGNRLLIVSLVAQLVYNIFINPSTTFTNFYAVKDTASTLLGKSNYISVFLAFAFLYEMIARDRKWVIFAGISIVGVIITLSRAAILSVAFCLFVYFVILLFNKNMKKKKAMIVLGAMSIAVWYFMINTSIGIQLIDGIKYGIASGNTAGRTVLWDMSYQQIKEKPYGNGIVNEADPHNIVLKVFRDMGIFFGLIYLIVLTKPLFNFLKLRIFNFNKQVIAALIAYLSVVVHAMLEIFFFTSSSIIWTALTLFFIYELIRKQRNDSMATQT